MNFAVDSRISEPKPVPESPAKLDEIADMLLTRAFLGVERIDSSHLRNARDRVTVRIQNVFQSQNTLYIHYSILNMGDRPYRALNPTVQQLFLARSPVSLPALKRTQLAGELVRKLGKTEASAVSVASAETQKHDIGPSEETQGVIAIRRKVESPVVLELTFAADSKHRVQAIVVL